MSGSALSSLLRGPSPSNLAPILISLRGMSNFSPNDAISPRIRNRNPMNLERMGVGYKPQGFPMEREPRNYWNRMFLSVKNRHTTARVVHWSGRLVAEASTREWAIAKFLYNYTDVAALETVAKAIGQRCLETGLHEVYLAIDPESMEKEKMRTFLEAIKGSGIVLRERSQYLQYEPFRHLGGYKIKQVKPWEIIDE